MKAWFKRTKTMAMLGAMTVVASLMTTGGVAHADTNPSEIWGWFGNSHRKCLDVRREDDSDHANARVQIWSCSGALEQQWSTRFYGLEPPSGEFGVRKSLYQIVSLRSGMCLEVRSGLTSNGATVDQIPCAAPGGSIDANDYQLWQVDFTTTETGLPFYAMAPYNAVRRGIGRCLDIPGNNSDNGTFVKLYECNGTWAQNFTGSLQNS